MILCGRPIMALHLKSFAISKMILLIAKLVKCNIFDLINTAGDGSHIDYCCHQSRRRFSITNTDHRAIPLRQLLHNSHRPPNTTRQSSLWCLAWRCELDNCYWRVSTSHFLSATVLSCRESNSHRRSGRATDKTVLSCLAWQCELALRFLFLITSTIWQNFIRVGQHSM